MLTWVRTRWGNVPRIGRNAALGPCVVGAIAAASCAAHADPDPPERMSVEVMAANAVARSALIDLKAVGAPTPRDYKVAEELLATAATLLSTAPREGEAPDQQTILRLYLEAAAGAGDTATVRKIARQLVALDPKDTVSQLRVISANISDMQTTDQRLAAYDRFIGKDGEDFDSTVRSRLALDAALLLRERGDLAGFADRLSQSLELDPTNKDAAMLALTFYSQRETDPKGRMDLMLSVLYADPFDTAIYSSLVEELLTSGAYKGASRFAKLERRLAIVQNRTPSQQDNLAYDLAEWNTAGPDAVIRRLSDALEGARQHATEQRRMATEQGFPTDAMSKAEEIHLPASIERSRLLCASALGDRERVSLFMSELVETTRVTNERLKDPARRPKGMTEEDALAAIQDSEMEMTWLRLWTGQQIDKAAAMLAELKGRGAGGLDPAVQSRWEGWLLVRSGKIEEGEAALTALAEGDSLARLGMAVAAELRSDTQTAIVRYSDVARRIPGELAGAYARSRYLALSGEPSRPSEIAMGLEANAAGVPSWLEVMVDNPRRVMMLDVVALRSEIQPIERTPVRVTLRNTSAIPLAMGPDKPLNTRLMFAPSVEMGGAKLPTTELGYITSIDRRLRLLPGESVDIVTWPDIGLLSFAMELAIPRQAKVRWRVLQGFELSDQRLYDAGPQCLTADMLPIMRRVPHRAEAVYEAMQFALTTGGPREIADAILSIQLQVAQSTKENGVPAADVDRLVETLARRFGSLPTASKILILCTLLPQVTLPPAVRVDQVASRDSDENVLAVTIATRLNSATDPLLTSPAVLKSPRLTALAQAVKEQIEAKVPTLGTAVVTVPQLIGTARMATVYENAPAPAADAGGANPGNPPNPPAEPKLVRYIAPCVPPDPAPVPNVP